MALESLATARFTSSLTGRIVVPSKHRAGVVNFCHKIRARRRQGGGGRETAPRGNYCCAAYVAVFRICGKRIPFVGVDYLPAHRDFSRHRCDLFVNVRLVPRLFAGTMLRAAWLQEPRR